MTNNSLKLSPYSVDDFKTPGFEYSRFQDKLDKLPGNLVDFLLEPSVVDFIESITKKYVQLSVQGPDIARLLRDVIIGDIFIGDMPQAMSNRLGIDPALAREVANQIVSQLFTPVIEDIKKVQNERYPGKLPQKPAPVTPQQSSVEVTPQQRHYQGEDLPESGGNIIDLRNTK